MVGLRERFVAAVLAGSFADALACAHEAKAHGLPFLYEEIVAGALIRVGQLWQEGQISVADEHVATAVAQSVLACLYPSFPWVETGPKAIVACVEGEQHALGARMAADLLACDGWCVTFVGADLPVDALVDLVVREAPVFVGLSVAMPDRLPSAREAVARLRRAAPRCKVLVGGRAVATEGAPVLDADMIARSATSAVEAVRPWKP